MLPPAGQDGPQAPGRAQKYGVSAPTSGPDLPNPKMTAPPRPADQPNLKMFGARISEISLDRNSLSSVVVQWGQD